MKRAALILIFVILCSTLVALAHAQDAPPPRREAPPPSELEPAVDTSAEPASPASPAADASTASAASPAASPGAPPTPRRPGARVMDRLELETTQITGNRELPKVLYIVPWKRSDLGDLVGKPVNSLLDEVLAPVDRDVFKRENRYYRALQPDESAGAGAAQAPDSRGRAKPAPETTPPARDER